MTLARPLSGILLAALTLVAGIAIPHAAKAQGLVDFLWGGDEEFGGGRSVVAFDPSYKPDQIVVSFADRRLYLIVKQGQAISYPVAVPTGEARWQGVTFVSNKRINPSWTPTPEMVRQNPRLPRWVPGGHPMNPLGVRALYLGSSAYRIHGTDAPWTIGQAVSHGCVRMINKDVLDLYPRVPVGMRVTVTWKQFSTHPIASNGDYSNYAATSSSSSASSASASASGDYASESDEASDSSDTPPRPRSRPKDGSISSLFFWDNNNNNDEAAAPPAEASESAPVDVQKKKSARAATPSSSKKVSASAEISDGDLVAPAKPSPSASRSSSSRSAASAHTKDRNKSTAPSTEASKSSPSSRDDSRRASAGNPAATRASATDGERANANGAPVNRAPSSGRDFDRAAPAAAPVTTVPATRASASGDEPLPVHQAVDRH